MWRWSRSACGCKVRDGAHKMCEKYKATTNTNKNAQKISKPAGGGPLEKKRGGGTDLT